MDIGKKSQEISSIVGGQIDFAIREYETTQFKSQASKYRIPYLKRVFKTLVVKYIPALEKLGYSATKEEDGDNYYRLELKRNNPLYNKIEFLIEFATGFNMYEGKIIFHNEANSKEFYFFQNSFDSLISVEVFDESMLGNIRNLVNSIIGSRDFSITPNDYWIEFNK